MSQREELIVLGHALNCPMCRSRMLNEPDKIFQGRALTSLEKDNLRKLTPENFANAELLANATGFGADELRSYTEHPVARLRHF
jgi:hypothetical protein